MRLFNDAVIRLGADPVCCQNADIQAAVEETAFHIDMNFKRWYENKKPHFKEVVNAYAVKERLTQAFIDRLYSLYFQPGVDRPELKN